MTAKALDLRFASALIAVHRLLFVQPSIGRRRLFDAVNEAYTYEALKESL